MRSRRRERSDVVDDAHLIKALEYCAGHKIGKKSDLIDFCGQATYDYLKKNGAICEYGDEYEYTKLGEVVRLTYYDMKGMGYWERWAPRLISRCFFLEILYFILINLYFQIYL